MIFPTLLLLSLPFLAQAAPQHSANPHVALAGRLVSTRDVAADCPTCTSFATTVSACVQLTSTADMGSSLLILALNELNEREAKLTLPPVSLVQEPASVPSTSSTISTRASSVLLWLLRLISLICSPPARVSFDVASSFLPCFGLSSGCCSCPFQELSFTSLHLLLSQRSLPLALSSESLVFLPSTASLLRPPRLPPPNLTRPSLRTLLRPLDKLQTPSLLPLLLESLPLTPEPPPTRPSRLPPARPQPKPFPLPPAPPSKFPLDSSRREDLSSSSELLESLELGLLPSNQHWKRE